MKAIALISGGLDSVLAAKLIKGEGVEVIPLNFSIPFCPRPKTGPTNPQIAASNLDQGLETFDLSQDFLKMLMAPRYGFGSNMNPCIDCKILMLSKAKELMGNFGASFVVTGEVLGQRPMSQHKDALKIIEKDSGLEGLLLRPLSAKLLPETIPEKNGWVKREGLLSFNGRTRKPQMDLAVRLGIKQYPSPAGGCLLTDPNFTKRLKDLISHGALNMKEIKLLKIGRHLRLTDKAKLIVGRDELENELLVSFAGQDDFLFYPGDDLAGATSLGRGEFNQELVNLACSITCHYCDLNKAGSAGIFYKQLPEAREKVLRARPLDERELAKLRI